MKRFDGRKLLLQFYANHGQLGLVSKNTGVPQSSLQAFIDGRSELSAKHKTMLDDYAKTKEAHED
jgi:hypothetical protein